MDSKTKVLVTEDMFMGKSNLAMELLIEAEGRGDIELVYLSREEIQDMSDEYLFDMKFLSDVRYMEPPQVKVPKRQKNPPRSYGNIGKGKQRRW